MFCDLFIFLFFTSTGFRWSAGSLPHTDLCVFIYVWGQIVGVKPQDDRVTVLRSIDISTSMYFLCSFYLYQLFSSFPLHSLSIFICSRFSHFLFWESVLSCFCHFFFSVSYFSLFISWLSVFLFSLNLQAPCVCRPSLSFPFLCTVDHSSDWPLAFYSSDSFSGNQVLYFLCSIVLSAGLWYACRYDSKVAGSHINEVKIGNWGKIKTISDWPFLKLCW